MEDFRNVTQVSEPRMGPEDLSVNRNVKPEASMEMESAEPILAVFDHFHPRLANPLQGFEKP